MQKMQRKTPIMINKNSLCCTPMPTSLSRLSSCLSSVLSFLECPVCFEIISPPAHQCPMGHLICSRCREEIERCPVCRTNFTRERSLLADQIYTAVIEAFHLKNQTIEERTKKLWERIFGKKKRDKNQSRVPTPKASKFEIKNKFLTRLIGKSSSVDNLTTEGSSFSPTLRKKSISSCDISQARAFNHFNNCSYSCSTESLPNRKSFYNADLNVENLFQFSTDISMSDSNANDALYHCPISNNCSPMSYYSLLTHLQQHPGPMIQFFRSNFAIHFPFSFDDDAVFVINAFDRAFFAKISSQNDDIKVYIWLIGRKELTEQFRAVASLHGDGDSSQTELSFITFINSIIYEQSRNIFANQILITRDTVLNYFPDKLFTLELSVVKK
ncbi:uncharacterized protein LOC135839698 isoform X2 [Planococcus citri]|uniref:uncharacterized protein LOC135839698 isoform X2 n=1 Tax=Planococcus citri TaxID=170843 RepID=UPI0031FA1515